MAALEAATQPLRVRELNYACVPESIGRVDTRPLGGRATPGHGEIWKAKFARRSITLKPAPSARYTDLTHASGRGGMVDAPDLKSVGAKALCRFKSGRPHHVTEIRESVIAGKKKNCRLRTTVGREDTAARAGDTA